MKKIFIFAVLTLALAGCQKQTAVSVNGSTNLNSNVINNNQNMAQVQNIPTAPNPADVEKVSQATFKTNLGEVTVELYSKDSPQTVANFVKLAKDGFYNGTKFHRVIKDFMIQGGDPLSKDDTIKTRWGTGGPGYTFPDEINSHKLVKGSLAMANAGPNTNGSQFFIVSAEATPWLDGHHTNFGQVVSGLDVVDKIQNVKTEGADRPVSDVIIESIELK
ncbi:MAG: peptidylprolyl isomerase [Patescibacteria group bacterium]|nr:peptidylprolyl isomerase [Patescibacteria group bacterium]